MSLLGNDIILRPPLKWINQNQRYSLWFFVTKNCNAFFSQNCTRCIFIAVSCHVASFFISRPTPRLLSFALCLAWINGT